MSNIVNIAVQILPVAAPERVYDLIDSAIEVVVQSGVPHRVCPFETVLEGPYEQLMDVVQKMQQACFDAGAEELILNMKMHVSKSKDVLIDDKMQKYH
jgi:uncharacterized protein YqgV (UPF0045/DUF77 family)